MRFSHVTVLLLLVGGERLGRAQAAICEKSLAYLEHQLPLTNSPKLNQLRVQTLQTDLIEAVRTTKEAGIVLSLAADLADKQAATFREALPTLERTIRGAAESRSGNLIVVALRSHSYTGISFGDDVLGAAESAYVAYDWGALANTETAKQLRCLAKSSNAVEVPEGRGRPADQDEVLSSDSGPSLSTTTAWLGKALSILSTTYTTTVVPYKKGSDKLVPKASDRQEHTQSWSHFRLQGCSLSFDDRQTTGVMFHYTVALNRIDQVAVVSFTHGANERIKLDTDHRYTDYDFTRDPLLEFTIRLSGKNAITGQAGQAVFPDVEYDLHIDEPVLGRRLQTAFEHAQEICHKQVKSASEPF